MKFIVSSSTLLKQLQQISGVLNSSNPLPILDNFLFIVEKGNLTISASDLESTMTTEVTLIEGKQSGKIAIPAKILLETLKTFSEHPLTFLIDDNDALASFGDFRRGDQACETAADHNHVCIACHHISPNHQND